MQDDVYSLEKKMRSPIKEPNRVLVQYDNAFRKPQFLSHSVFEDNVSAFKEESTPNLLSTAASSLSSLTIDDDDYTYENNAQHNRAALMKANEPKVAHQNATSNDWNATRHMCESFRSMKVTTNANESLGDQQNGFSKQQADEKYYDNRRINKPQEHHFMKSTDQCNFRREQRSTCSQNSDQYLYINRKPVDGCHPENTPLRILPQNLKIDKSSNNYISKERRVDNRDRPMVNDNKKALQNFFNSHESIPYEENSENLAYEELLLDQCIRKGKAKVTKKNINDIKPFSWDVNQICLTTKVMSKSYTEEIKREKKDDRKYFGLQKQSKRH